MSSASRASPFLGRDTNLDEKHAGIADPEVPKVARALPDIAHVYETHYVSEVRESNEVGVHKQPTQVHEEACGQNVLPRSGIKEGHKHTHPTNCDISENVDDKFFLRDSQLSTILPSKSIGIHSSSKTPATRSRNPSKFIISPFLTDFGSSDKEKGKEKMQYQFRQKYPFDDFGICYHLPFDLIEEYTIWISKGLLMRHANRKQKDEHYKLRSSGLGVEYFDFVVAFPSDKNWFYLMSEKNRCWKEEHLDVIFYYLRKKAKFQYSNDYRYTTLNCNFKNFIEIAYSRYYLSGADPNISTQEDHALGLFVSKNEISVTSIIKGICLPAGTPWHLVDEVYIPVNFDVDFHWVLAVVVLKERLIRIYDSSRGSRQKNSRDEIHKLTVMLPTYLINSQFFEKIKRTDWPTLDAHKDKSTGELLGPEHPLSCLFFAFSYWP